jgi:hypothetical protein
VQAPRHSPPAASAVVVWRAWRASPGSAPARRWRLHAGVIVRVALESHSCCCGSATLEFTVNDNCSHPHSVVCANWTADFRLTHDPGPCLPSNPSHHDARSYIGHLLAQNTTSTPRPWHHTRRPRLPLATGARGSHMASSRASRRRGLASSTTMRLRPNDHINMQ